MKKTWKRHSTNRVWHLLKVPSNFSATSVLNCFSMKWNISQTSTSSTGFSFIISRTVELKNKKPPNAKLPSKMIDRSKSSQCAKHNVSGELRGGDLIATWLAGRGYARNHCAGNLPLCDFRSIFSLSKSRKLIIIKDDELMRLLFGREMISSAATVQS